MCFYGGRDLQHAAVSFASRIPVDPDRVSIRRLYLVAAGDPITPVVFSLGFYERGWSVELLFVFKPLPMAAFFYAAFAQSLQPKDCVGGCGCCRLLLSCGTTLP